MKVWILLAAFSAPWAALAADAPPPPMVQAPNAVTDTVEVVKAPQIPDPTPVASSSAPVTVKVYARDPHAALMASLWPGVFLHGWGHHVAGDDDTFLNLAGGELFGVVMLGFGLNEALGPDVKDETKVTSQSLAIAGGVVFGITWLWDVVGASAAAANFNKEHNLSLAPLPGGAQVALNTRF